MILLAFDYNKYLTSDWNVRTRDKQKISSFHSKLLMCEDESDIFELCFRAGHKFKINGDMSRNMTVLNKSDYAIIGSNEHNIIDTDNPMMYFSIYRLNVMMARCGGNIWISRYMYDHLLCDYLRNYSDGDSLASLLRPISV